MNVASSSSSGAKTLQRAVARMESRLHSLDSARRRHRVLRALADRLFGGVLLACGVLLLGHYVRAAHHPITVVLAVLVCSAVVLRDAIGRRRGIPEIALWVDDRAGLDERVSSAIAFIGEPETTPMMREAVADAENQLAHVGVDAVVDAPPSRRWWAALLLLPLLLFLALVPPRLTSAELAAQTTQRVIRAAGTELIDAADAAAEHLSPDASADARTQIEQAREAGEALQSGDAATREDAMDRLQRARQSTHGALREDTAREQLGEQLQQNSTTRAAGDALSRGDTRGAAEAMRRTADGLTKRDLRGPAGKQLAKNLRSAALGLPLGAARAAANRAAAGAEAARPDAAQEGLRDLADQMEQMAALEQDRAAVAQAAQALDQAAQEVGSAQAQAAAPSADAPRAGTPSDAAGQQSAGQSEADSQSGAQGADVVGAAGAAAGAGDGAVQMGQAHKLPPLSSGVRVDLAGRLMGGERSDGARTGGARVAEDDVPELSRAVAQFRDIGEAEIARQQIPPGRRSLVREYYSVLQDVAGDAPARTDETK